MATKESRGFFGNFGFVAAPGTSYANGKTGDPLSNEFDINSGGGRGRGVTIMSLRGGTRTEPAARNLPVHAPLARLTGVQG